MSARRDLGTKSRPLWNMRPDSVVKSELPCTTASRHSESSQKAVLKRSRRAELSTARVVRADTVGGGEMILVGVE